MEQISVVSEQTQTEKVPIHLKMTLTAKEAAEYSNIGINKIENNIDATYENFCLLYFSITNIVIKKKMLKTTFVAGDTL